MSDDEAFPLSDPGPDEYADGQYEREQILTHQAMAMEPLTEAIEAIL